jgi:hypothetical protein
MLEVAILPVHPGWRLFDFAMSATSSPLSSNGMQMRVVIPARNEQQSIEQALDALRGQVDLAGAPLVPGCFDVTVLATDSNGAATMAARAYAERYPAFPLRLLERAVAGEVPLGEARRSLFEDACARFDAEGQIGIVASTDAHTVVAPDWVAATLDEFARGVDAVGGRVVLSPEDLDQMDPALRRAHVQDTGYHLLLAELGARVDPNPNDPFPCHYQHHSASLALRTDVYRRAGGIPNEGNPDDSLYDALERIDARIRHSPNVRAITRARCIGLLEDWAVTAISRQPLLVEPVMRSVKRLQLRRELRGRWRFRRSHRELEQGTRMDTFAFFGAFLADVRSEIERYLDETAGNEPVPLPAAIDDLRTTLTTYH